MVITSPPYLNAIDYLRGHKLSLVWMRHPITELRTIRSSNIGTEAGSGSSAKLTSTLRRAFAAALSDRDLPNAQTGMFVRYLRDMESVLFEIRRVIKDQGQAVLVVGDCNIRGTFVKNSAAIKRLARQAGLSCN